MSPESAWASEARFSSLLESTSEGIWGLDDAGRCIFANPACLSLLGYARTDELLGHAAPPTEDIASYSQWPCIHPDGRPFKPEEYPLARALRTGEIVHNEPIDYRFGDGTRGTIEVSAAPVRDSRGEVMAAVVVYGDITERRRMEAEAQRRAEFEKHLIGIVSHDLRNRIQIAPHPTDLGDAAQHVVEEMRLANPEREIRLRCAGDTRGVYDGDRIVQVLTNLLSNAVAYSPVGSPIDLAVEGGPAELILVVRNGGPPIPEALLPDLFVPMQRGTGSVDHAGKSIGLGLYIVLQIIRAHGGTISVRSTSVEGTQFEVRLPREVGRPAGPRAAPQ